MCRLLSLSLFLLWTSAGCVVVQNEVTNPVVGLSTVAVAPFINLSAERTVDGREMAMAYFSELQKVPGFQVVPVGVTEQVIYDHGLQFEDPQDAVRLAELLNVDAVVLGAITDFNPYFPPRIGMKVAWYSPRGWSFSPGVAVDSGDKGPGALSFPAHGWAPVSSLWPWGQGPSRSGDVEHCDLTESAPTAVRGQTPGAFRDVRELPQPNRKLTVPGFPQRMRASRNDVTWAGAQDAPRVAPPAPVTTPPLGVPPLQTPGQAVPVPGQPRVSGGPQVAPRGEPDMARRSNPPVRAFMSYTRLFDASDAEFLARLRDYLELSGDRDLGGVDGHLHDVDRFVRFVSHLMISEMLTLHGGEGRTRIVLKRRKHK
ncbi:MAG: hypothetical protein ABGZ17_05530 [Planctomycetaceae bacterium]